MFLNYFRERMEKVASIAANICTFTSDNILKFL